MQELIEEAIRWIGYLSLRVVTLGRYASEGSNDRLIEGAVGLGLIALASYVALSPWSA